MIFSFVLLSILASITVAGRKGTEGLKGVAVGIMEDPRDKWKEDLTKKFTGHATVEAGTCLISEYADGSSHGEAPEMARWHHECPLRTVGEYCEEPWDCDQYKCVNNKCATSSMDWGNECYLFHDRTMDERRKGTEGLKGVAVGAGHTTEAETAVGMACPDGMRWSSFVGRCIDATEAETAVGMPCPDGMRWSSIVGRCFDATEAETAVGMPCPDGMRWSPIVGRCFDATGDGEAAFQAMKVKRRSLPSVLYVFSFIGLASLLFGAGMHYCGRKQEPFIVMV